MNATRGTFVLAAASLVLFLGAGTAGASQPVLPRGGDPLQRLRAETPPALGVQRPSPPAGRDRLPRRTALVWALLVSAAWLAVVISAIQSKRPLRLAKEGVQSPEGGVQMRRRFIDRKVEGEAQEESTAGAFATGQDWPGAPRADRPEAAAQPASTEGEGGAGAQQAAASFSDLGQHVATVLETAREAAGRIEADARSEAARLLERSRSEAQERIAGARQKAEELQAEAVRARSEANEAAEEVRARADAYAEQKRREADEAAAEVVVEAERTARERSRAAEDRQQALNANVERTEDRLRRLVIGLRELAGRLDVLVGSDALTELAEPQLEPARPPTLEEALRRHAAASEAPDELGSETEPDAQRS